jgi:hypothetical protein
MSKSPLRSVAYFLLAMLTILVGTLYSRKAEAQTYCFPTAIGVPGQPGPPDWWTSPQPLDDPRWQGALGNTTGAGDQAEFRALTYSDGAKDYVLLFLQVKADPGPAGSGDVIFFGLSDGLAGGVSNVIRLVRGGSSSTAAEGTTPPAADVNIRYLNAGTWIDVPAKPAWLTADTRINQTCSGAPAICDTWTYRVRVPIDPAATADNPANGVKIAAAGFKAWSEMKVASVDGVGTSYTTRHKWPPTAPNAGGSPETYPDPTSVNWNAAKLGAGGACAAGVSLIASHIEVTNSGTASGHEISVINPNTFHVRPLNGMATAVNDQGISANLRIANWGSAVGDSPSWEPIPAPSVNCAAASGPGAGDIGSGSQFDLTCTWTLTDLQKCTYRPDLYNAGNTPACATMPPAKYRHQCILAKLSLSPGSPVPVFFSRESAWRNMDFVNASRFERQAEIDIRGLAPTAEPQRDVYIYVKAQNMPDKVAPDDEKDAATSPLDPAANPNVKNRGRAALPALRKGRVGTKEAAALQRLLSAGQISLDQIAEVMPTQTLYVWYDTGKKDGPAKILEPMPSFGYFVAHDGTLTGWDHSVAGIGAALTQVGPHFYRLAVPHNGSAKVNTVIVANEGNEPGPAPSPPRPPWFWIAVGLGILLLLVILFLLLRPKP